MVTWRLLLICLLLALACVAIPFIVRGDELPVPTCLPPGVPAVAELAHRETTPNMGKTERGQFVPVMAYLYQHLASGASFAFYWTSNVLAVIDTDPFGPTPVYIDRGAIVDRLGRGFIRETPVQSCDWRRLTAPVPGDLES